MKKVILHIGVHKTGSSSIQESMFRARKNLAEQGISYFTKDMDGRERALPRKWINSTNFNNVFIENPKLFNERISECSEERVFISIEDFSWFLKKEQFSSIKEAFKGHDVTVIGYIRRQDRQIVSYMQEGSKSRHKPSIRYYGQTLKALPSNFKTEYLDYYSRFKNWDELFPGKVIFKVFEKACRANGDVVKDISKFLNVKNIQTVRTNESLNFIQTKLGHLINKIEFKNGELEDSLRALSNSIKYPQKSLPSKQEAILIFERFAHSNELMASVLGIEGKDLFDSDFSAYEVLPNDLWDEDSANIAITALLNFIKQGKL